MAQRTINEIYESIIVEKNNMETLRNKLTNEDGSTTLSDEQDLLDSLSSSSKVAIWKLWAYLTAVVIYVHEGLWYQFKKDVTSIIDTSFVGTRKWLINEAKKFQYGDDLTLDTDYYNLYYTVKDENKQIIGSANATESGGNVQLKVRRKDTDILSGPEMTSFVNYINNIKIAGQRVSILNYPGDELKLYFTIYYQGMYNSTIIQSNVEDVIYEYIQNIEFDSTINITKLVDNIQNIDGVEGVDFDATQSGGLPNTYTTWIPITNYYNSVAGWNTISPSYPLTSTITYIAR